MRYRAYLVFLIFAGIATFVLDVISYILFNNMPISARIAKQMEWIDKQKEEERKKQNA